MRFRVSFCCLLVIANLSVAQNSPVFSNFMFVKPLSNPASVGSEDMLVFSALYRAQWVGIKGAPSVQAFSVHSPLTVLNSSAGVYATNEMQGEERVTRVILSYAYRYSLKKGSLAFGISGGVMQRAINGGKLRAPEGNYESSFNHNDDFIPASLSSGITGDLNLGVYFQTKKTYIGLSAINLIESSVTLQGQVQKSELKNPRYYSVAAGYRFKVGKKLYLLPNVSIHSDFVNVQPEVNVILQYKDNIYGGISFRGIAPDSKDALILMLGFKILKNLRVGYSYDFAMSSVNNATTGSHEVYVQYGIKIKDIINPGKVIYNPRFL